MSREGIYSALFALLQTTSGITTFSRRLRHWADVNPPEMPALFMAQRGESAKTTTGQPTIWQMNVDIIVYVKDDGTPLAIPSSVLNPIVDSIINLFAPNPISGKQTLGGLVQYVRVNGGIAIDEGVQGDTVIAVIPIEILYA